MNVRDADDVVRVVAVEVVDVEVDVEVVAAVENAAFLLVVPLIRNR